MVKQSNRLLALDILRGITVAGMILVNNPGSWDYVFAPLYHAGWNGLTPCDLVFPFFMFIMGISTYISLLKFDFKPDKKTIIKILRRTVVIFAIGLGVAWISLSLRTFHSLADLSTGERLMHSITNFGHIRILGVMQRMALTYCFVSLIAIFVKHKFIPAIVIITLAVYAVVLHYFNGTDFDAQNIIARIDVAILGANHMYNDMGLAFDPEGILSTIPATMHVLIGFWCGKILLSTKDNNLRIQYLFIIGAVLMAGGYFLQYGMPINKKIWSSTFTFMTCGMTATLLALLIWIIDIKGYKKWSVFFESFGVNPLFTYVVASVLSSIIGGVWISHAGSIITLKGYIFQTLFYPTLGGFAGSLAYALIFVTLIWIMGHTLYKKQIYIKI